MAPVDKDAPRVDVAPAPVAPRRAHLAKVDDGDRPFLRAEGRKRLHDEAERDLGRRGEVVGRGEVVRRRAHEARVAVALVDGDVVGRGERGRGPGARQVRLNAVQLLVGVLDRDGRGDVVRVDADALLGRDALPGRVGRLRDPTLRLVLLVLLLELLLLLVVVRRRGRARRVARHAGGHLGVRRRALVVTHLGADLGRQPRALLELLRLLVLLLLLLLHVVVVLLVVELLLMRVHVLLPAVVLRKVRRLVLLLVHWLEL